MPLAFEMLVFIRDFSTWVTVTVYISETGSMVWLIVKLSAMVICSMSSITAEKALYKISARMPLFLPHKVFAIPWKTYLSGFVLVICLTSPQWSPHLWISRDVCVMLWGDSVILSKLLSDASLKILRFTWYVFDMTIGTI